MLLLLLALLQIPTPATPPTTQRFAYESVIHDRGKTIGTTIMIELTGTSVAGWIQKHDFQQITAGTKTDTGYDFQAAGNHYQMNLRTARIVYSGPDGAGDQHVTMMEPLRGRVYKIREETDEGREMTLQTDHGDQVFEIEQEPAVWKHSGPPIGKYQMERFEEILGKTTTVWRVRTGGVWTIEVFEEPEGMDILPKVLKEKKKKK